MKKNSAAELNTGGETTAAIYTTVRLSFAFFSVVLALFVLYNSAINPFKILPVSSAYNAYRRSSASPHRDPLLEKVLKNASTEDGTVILTTLNGAWAEPDSLLDLFLKSFHIGNGTEKLLKHLVIVSLDGKAHSRCAAVHPHCYQLNTEGNNYSGEAYFMTSDYLHMMWRRIQFLTQVLEMGFGFVFTDSDIMWLQDPFDHFHPDADFQIACDTFLGNSADLNNHPNGGFVYVKSNPRTIKFYQFWYDSRRIYTGKHDQEVLEKIKHSPLLPIIGLKVRFLDTANFGGFCQMGHDFHKVSTVHANCCVGLANKVNDLRLLLRDWTKFFNQTQDQKANYTPTWSVPQDCRNSFLRGGRPNEHKEIIMGRSL